MSRQPLEVVSQATGDSNRAWQDTTNAIASDDNHATVSAMTEGEVSELLLGRQLELGIPADAIITGVEVAIERSGLAGVGIVDHSVALRGLGVNSDSKTQPGVWSNTDTLAFYGDPQDTWGLGLVATQVNQPEFGVGIAVRYSITAGNDWPRVDSIVVNVHYDAPGCP